ncbi:uncharacterized protein [Symphalangus syndactylus]|uniref:uncharacterized protein isoform X1 n=1 Tax=Symphalangus syndactylus TaxID=9590 RepID=UPI002441B9D8|nr:uncharacterized protein LOC129490598 isoform X1 [Symphalangus syndactylus]
MISKMRKQKLGYVSKYFQGPAANQWLTTSFLCLCCHPCHGLCQDSRRSLPSAPQLLCTNPECQTEGRRKDAWVLTVNYDFRDQLGIKCLSGEDIKDYLEGARPHSLKERDIHLFPLPAHWL